MRILLIRPNKNEVDKAQLEAAGFEVEVDPYLSISQVDNVDGALRMLEAVRLPEKKWLLATSTNAMDFWQRQLPENSLEEAINASENISFGAIGLQTKAILKSFGAKDVIIPETSNGTSLADQIAKTEPAVVIQPAGSIAMKDIPNTLEPIGFEMITEVVYQTEAVTEAPQSVGEIAEGKFDAVLFRSPSASRAFFEYNPDPKLKLISAGKTTAKQIAELGYQADLVIEKPDPKSIAKEIQRWARND